jgi:hypothetical protein
MCVWLSIKESHVACIFALYIKSENAFAFGRGPVRRGRGRGLARTGLGRCAFLCRNFDHGSWPVKRFLACGVTVVLFVSASEAPML